MYEKITKNNDKKPFLEYCSSLWHLHFLKIDKFILSATQVVVFLRELTAILGFNALFTALLLQL